MQHRSSAPRHGGVLLAASRLYGIAPADWLDLSTGINPDPYPSRDVQQEDLQRLPDPDFLAGLIEAARDAYRVPSHLSVLAVPGSDIALRMLPSLWLKGRATILSPTYSGHAEGWRSAGHEVLEVAALEAARAAVTIVANPNNPDGRILDPRSLLAHAAERTVIVDEAFAEVAPEASVIPHLSREAILVLRSFGKFYGLAGLRLGFVIGAEALLAPLRRLLGDWPVSGAAIAIGTRALLDREWQAATRIRLAERSRAVDALLRQNDLELAGGTSLFRLVRRPDAARLHEALAQRGVWTRIFENQPDWIRIGLPREDQLSRLAEALPGGETHGLQPGFSA